jgi:peptide/nickel transport system ATP-binding protein
MSILLITHDLGVVAENAKYVVVMYAGTVVESAPVGEIFASPRHPYTLGLLESIPRAGAARGRRLHTIEGLVPDLRKPRKGCRFADRCPMRIDRCREEEPELVAIGDGAPPGSEHTSRCWRAEEVGR